MPTAKVCLWNVQNYGARSAEAKWGADGGLRNRFIGNFLAAEGIEVLLMMEAGAFSAASLRDLGLWLNVRHDAKDADWCLSLCGTALLRDLPNPPASPADLTFRTDARTEGYAVAWRSGRADFRVLRGLNPIAEKPIASRRNPAPPDRTPLNMVTRGRPTGNYEETVLRGRKRERPEQGFGALGGYLPPGLYPYDIEGGEMDHWPPLPFPTTSTRNPAQTKLRKARRPAYVVLELADGGDASRGLCPAAVYHAPSNASQAELGAMMAGLSRELYVTNGLAAASDPDSGPVPDPDALTHCRSTILGGDFNYSVDGAGWPAYYAFFTGAFHRGQAGGAAATPAPAPGDADAGRRTTVQLLEGDHATPINTAHLDDYFRHKIDLVFTRGDAAGARVNLPRILLDDAAGAYAATLAAFHTHLAGIVAGLKGPVFRMSPAGTGPQVRRRVQDERGSWSFEWRPLLCGSWGGTFLDWDAFMGQLGNGRFTAARQVAEFYHIFVSDHLPLVATIAW